jgi:hypothetical protein
MLVVGGVAVVLAAAGTSAALASRAHTVGTANARVTLTVRPTAPVSTKPVVLSSKVKPQPANTTAATGQVCFYDGPATTPLSCQPIAKSAKGVQSARVKVSLSAGNHTMTARYSGDSTYAPQASKPVVITVK